MLGETRRIWKKFMEFQLIYRNQADNGFILLYPFSEPDSGFAIADELDSLVS